MGERLSRFGQRISGHGVTQSDKPNNTQLNIMIILVTRNCKVNENNFCKTPMNSEETLSKSNTKRIYDNKYIIKRNLSRKRMNFSNRVKEKKIKKII